jgi:hypothetical protein
LGSALVVRVFAFQGGGLQADSAESTRADLLLSLFCVFLQEAIISHGCTVKSSTINHAVVGLRSHIEEGCTIEVSLAVTDTRSHSHSVAAGLIGLLGAFLAAAHFSPWPMAWQASQLGARQLRTDACNSHATIHLCISSFVWHGHMAALALARLPLNLTCLSPFLPQDTLIIGADYYESEEQRAKVLKDGGVPLGIGSNSVVKNCIVDKNARIGRNVKIVNEKGVQVCVGGSPCRVLRATAGMSSPGECGVRDQGFVGRGGGCSVFRSQLDAWLDLLRV